MRGISQRMSEEGRAHPFVEALVREIRARRVGVLTKLQEAAASASDAAESPRLYQLGGRAASYEEVIRLIETTGED